MNNNELIKELNSKTDFEVAYILHKIDNEKFVKAFLMSLLPLNNPQYSKDFIEDIADKAYIHYINNDNSLIDESLWEIIDNAVQEEFEKINHHTKRR